MPKILKRTDRTHRVALTAPVRCFWSRRRAYHGEVVKMHVEVRYVASGSPVKLQIFSAAQDGGGADLIDEFEDQIRDGECVRDHTLSFRAEDTARGTALTGSVREFHFTATLPDHGIEGRSPALYVDLVKFRFSE